MLPVAFATREGYLHDSLRTSQPFRVRGIKDVRRVPERDKVTLVKLTDGYQDRTGWYVSLSSYWFASSFSWFVLLTVVLPKQVAQVVPEGTKNTAWGMVFALGAVWASVGPSLFGALSDRAGKRSRFIALGAALTIAALGLLCFAHTLGQIAAGYLLLQVADDVGTGPCSALIPQYVPKERRGKASGIMSLLSLGGQLTAAPAAYFSGGDPKFVYAAIGVVTIICALIAFITVQRLESGLVEKNRESFLHGFLRGWIAPWRNRDFFLVWGAKLLFSLGLYLTEPYLRNYLEDVVKTFHVLGLNVLDADRATTLLALVITLCAAGGSAIGGGWSDRAGRKRVVLTGGGIMATALVPFLLFHRYDLLLAIAIVFGIGYGIFLSADWALASDVMPDEEALGRDMGIWQMSESVVQVFAGSAGRIVDWGNRQSMGTGYQVVFGLGAFAFVLGTVVVRLVRSVR